MKRIGHALMVVLLLYLSGSALWDAPGNLVDVGLWPRVVGVLQVLSSGACVAWLVGLWKRARWTRPAFWAWCAFLIPLGSVASVAWDTFAWAPVLGAALSLTVVCALFHWWMRGILKRDAIPAGH